MGSIRFRVNQSYKEVIPKMFLLIFLIIFPFTEEFFCLVQLFEEGKMLFVRTLTPEEEKELPQRLKAATKTKVYIRLKTVELSSQGKSVQEISTLLGRHPNSVRSYIHRFNDGGGGRGQASVGRRRHPEAPRLGQGLLGGSALLSSF